MPDCPNCNAEMDEELGVGITHQGHVDVPIWACSTCGHSENMSAEDLLPDDPRYDEAYA